LLSKIKYLKRLQLTVACRLKPADDLRLWFKNACEFLPEYIQRVNDIQIYKQILRDVNSLIFEELRSKIKSFTAATAVASNKPSNKDITNIGKALFLRKQLKTLEAELHLKLDALKIDFCTECNSN
jgi:activator of HSP90 ATPase